MKPEHKHRKVYWGGIDNTTIPMMATGAEREAELQKEIWEWEEKIKNSKGKNHEEYIKYVKEKKKAQKELNDLEKKGLESSMKMSTLSSLQDSLEKNISKSIKGRMGNITVMTADYYKMGSAGQKFLETQMNLPGLQDDLNSGITKATSLLGSDSLILQNIGKYYGGLLESQATAVDLTQKLGEQYDDIGSDSFQDMSKEAETALKSAQRHKDFISKEAIPAIREERLVQVGSYDDLAKKALEGVAKKREAAYADIDASKMSAKAKRAAMKQIDKDLMAQEDLIVKNADLTEDQTKEIQESADSEKDLTKQANTNLKTAEKNEATAKRNKILHEQTAASVGFIAGPLEKAKSLLESMPMGGVISQFMGLNDIVGDFKEGITGSFKAAIDDQNNFNPGLAFENMNKQVTETFGQIGEGFNHFKKMGKGMMKPMLKSIKAITMQAWQFVKAALANPYVAVAAAIALIGVLLYKAMNYAEAMRQEFGVMRGDAFEIQTAVDATAMHFKLLGVSAEDVGTMAQGIADSMGGVSNITQENLSTMAELQGLYGMSADSIAPAMTAMKALGAESNAAASAQLAQIGHMAQMEGVAPAKVFEDITANMGTFSRFGKEGGKNLAEASIMARKLGTSLESMAATSDALLDFESNINDQMEASMLLGRSINMDKARELALAGDVAGQEREILKQIGTQAQWEKMNVVQRDALAKATGKSTEDLASMLANQANLNAMTAEERANKEAMQKSDEKANEGMKAAGKSMGDAWSAIMAPLKEVMMAVQPLLGLLMKIIGFALKPIVFQFKLIGFVIKPIIKVLGFVLGIITDIVKWVEDGIMSVFGDMGGIVSDIGGQIYSFLLVPFEMLFGVAKSIFSVILSVGKAIFSVLVLPFKLLWEGVKLGFSLITSFGKAIFGVGQSIFNALITPFKMLWDGIKAGFAMWVGLIKAPFNLIIAGVNMVINAINSLSVKVPDWVPLIGGKEFGFNIPNVPSLATEPGGPGHNVKETGVAEVHKGESVGTFDMSQTNSKLDQLIQLLGQSGPIAVGVGGVKSNTKSISDQIV